LGSFSFCAFLALASALFLALTLCCGSDGKSTTESWLCGSPVNVEKLVSLAYLKPGFYDITEVNFDPYG
jgi:hypothetical protein